MWEAMRNLTKEVQNSSKFKLFKTVQFAIFEQD